LKDLSNHLINHIVFVLDESPSMRGHADNLIKVWDNQVAYLASRSRELDQETRVTVYAFNSRNTVKCVIWDTDVLRLPSIKDKYQPLYGFTALLDASHLALDDLSLISEKYGDHAFLVYVLTDGIENDSINRLPSVLKGKIEILPENKTVAVFVPNQTAVFEAKKAGFPSGNISVWDTTEAGSIAEVGAVMRSATESYMTARSAGVRGTKNLFSLNAVPESKVKAELIPVQRGKYDILPVLSDQRIDEFVLQRTGQYYVPGRGYYQLTRPVIVQPQKKIAILTSDGKLYMGNNARKLMGLPDHEVKVSPASYLDYKVFIQSTALNRKLLENTSLLLFREN
jgi:hypothetical protein